MESEITKLVDSERAINILRQGQKDKKSTESEHPEEETQQL